jgi:mono/diheme cytochrome c family protein
MLRTRKSTSAIAFCISFLMAGADAAEKDSSVTRGRKLFERATCAGCHPSGDNLVHPSKVLKGKEFAAKYKNDQDIVKVVRSGVPNTGMPSFSKQQLSDAELKAIIAYIRSLTPPEVKPIKCPNANTPKKNVSVDKSSRLASPGSKVAPYKVR